ncbi:Spindle assembly checkpoint component MAD1 [Cytospora mali]|uniref:Spindle assembly checkpoint component MAD1 n=1 Tax=Cytospora mali TaxID=578113 RepID=A0A194VYB1_CYTMA|nr:Spindle assembly checkpoint component MAD1 [Valsa mali]
MVPHTPQGSGGDRPSSAAGSRRDSVSSNTGGNRFGTSSLPRPQTSLRESRLNAIRANSSQPSFNLLKAEGLAGNPLAKSQSRSRSISRSRHSTTSPAFQGSMSPDSSKENMAPPDAEKYEAQRRQIEQLKADLGTLRYNITTSEAEKEITRLQHENELRKAKELADDEFKKKQAEESEKSAALRLVERFQQELQELRDGQDGEKAEAEARAKAAEEEARALREELEDMSSAKDEQARMEERKVADLHVQIQTARNQVTALEQDGQAKETLLQQTQAQLAEKDNAISEMESEVLRLKAQTGDADTMAIIRRELSELVTHCRDLEATNREQLAELKRLRQTHKAVEIVEEEKATLHRRLEAAEDMKAELAEERRQRERLQTERLAWAAYLEREGQADFDSPEAVARALVQERLNSASLLEKLGSVQPQIAERDEIIKDLEEEKATLAGRVERLKSNPGTGSTDKARQRLDRQRALAEKEVEFLRAQLRSYDSEDLTLQPEAYDEKKAQRIQELESLVDKYKAEVQALQSELSSLELSSTSPTAVAGTKRPLPTDDEETNTQHHEQLGQLARKNRTLQDEFTTLQTSHKLLQKELAVAQEQLAAAKQSSNVRVLQLRANPTDDYQAVKQAAIDELRSENEQLRRLVHDGEAARFPVVPVSTLIALQRDLQAARDETASARKKCQRLKEVWTDKSAEFKEAVFQLLGWHVTFIPSNKMRLESVYYPSETDEHERSIVFDGERGSMKVGGGPKSAFAMKINDTRKYWVTEKNCIPGFLAALTLELYDEAVRDGKEI